MMDELLEYGIYLALLVAIAIPLSAYINKVMAGERTLFSRVLVPVENVVYRCIRVDRTEGYRQESCALFRQPHKPAVRCGYPSSRVTSR